MGSEKEPRGEKKKEKMGRSNRRRDRGGARRRRRRSGGVEKSKGVEERGVSTGKKEKPAAKGERQRRRRRRARGRGRVVSREEGKSREGGLERKGRQSREGRQRRTSRRGVLRRREVKQGDREKWKRRTNGEYRRRLGRGVVGGVVLLGVGERREIYLGRERRALSTYVRVGYRRGSAYATEAARKYFRVGALASARRVRGRIRRYGETGRLKREERSRRGGRSGTEERGSGTLGRRRRRWVRRFKRGARPVHRWVADVYEGAPTRAGRYLLLVPKRGRRVRSVRRAGRRGTGRGGKERERLRSRVGRGSVRVGGRGRLVQRRWKRYRAYSGRGTVGGRRRGGRRRTEAGRKGRRRTMRMYRVRVLLMWGVLMRREVEERGYKGVKGGRVGEQEKEKRERKYRTELRGRGKENGNRGKSRMRGRMSRAGRPPRVGFGAKRSVRNGLVEKGVEAGEVRYRERAGRYLVLGRVGVYGYVRIVKRMEMESEEGRKVRVGGKIERRKRKMKKEGGRRLGVGTRVRVRGWRNGEGVERWRDRVVRKGR